MTDFAEAPAAATAACGAYLLVALADARVHAIEEARFLGGVVNDAAFKSISSSALADEYNRLYAALQADWDAAEAEILTAITKIRTDVGAVKAVKVAARQAVIADHSIKAQEDFVLARIARALGFTPEDL